MPSLTTILSVAFLGYMANSMWNIIQLYIPPTCPAGIICYILLAAIILVKSLILSS